MTRRGDVEAVGVGVGGTGTGTSHAFTARTRMTHARAASLVSTAVGTRVEHPKRGVGTVSEHMDDGHAVG